MSGAPFGTLVEHLPALRAALHHLEAAQPRLESWAADLADVFARGGRLLAAGNGGSAAEAQHLTAELVGRFEDEDRVPLPALALHAETSTVTAVLNDFGGAEVFARQVHAHGRPGDVLVLLSTSGSSRNLLDAAHRARGLDVQVWALTGPAPNPLAALADRAYCVPEPAGTVVQEVHLVFVHALCAALERHLARRRSASCGPSREPGSTEGHGKGAWACESS